MSISSLLWMGMCTPSGNGCWGHWMLLSPTQYHDVQAALKVAAWIEGSYPTSVLEDSASSLLPPGYSLYLRPALFSLFLPLLPSSSLGASLDPDPCSWVEALIIGQQTSWGCLPEFLSSTSLNPLSLCSTDLLLFEVCSHRLYFLISASPSVLVSPVFDIPGEPGSICHPHDFPHLAVVKGYKREKVLMDQIQAMGLESHTKHEPVSSRVPKAPIASSSQVHTGSQPSAYETAPEFFRTCGCTIC